MKSMPFEMLRSPVSFLRHMLPSVPAGDMLAEYEGWWEREGKVISESTDRANTPKLRMFDRRGDRVDEILYPAERWRALRMGYKAGAVWRTVDERSPVSSCLLAYLTSFYDPGLACPHAVSLGTAASLYKHGSETLQQRFLPPLLRRDDSVWEGATWMTEIGGGSDLGAGVTSMARPVGGDEWRITGDKYFASNAGAEVAVVASRIDGAPAGLGGVALFVVPRVREDGSRNYTIRRLKDKAGTRSVATGEVELRESEAYLLGRADQGIYVILEVLNLSRVANSMGSVGVALRAMAEALMFAGGRVAFGKPIVQHPLLAKQFEERLAALEGAFALSWEAVRQLDLHWLDRRPYPESFHLFRLLTHLAKYWTSELAPQVARWGMEVHGGLGVLEEFPAERWFREAMVLTIWEGTCHRQILDGVEVMERKAAHRPLLELLRPAAGSAACEEMAARIDAHLALPVAIREARSEELFRDLAILTANSLSALLKSGARAHA